MDFIFIAVLLITVIIAFLFVLSKTKETNQQNQEAIRQAQARRENIEKQLNELIELQKVQIEIQKQTLEELKNR